MHSRELWGIKAGRSGIACGDIATETTAVALSELPKAAAEATTNRPRIVTRQPSVEALVYSLATDSFATPARPTWWASRPGWHV